MALLNYTTKVPAEQTIGEMQNMLKDHGVSAMMTEYDGRLVSSVSFELKLQGKKIAFKLPCNWLAVREIFKKQGVRLKHGGTIDEQAIRTAWRVIKVWLEGQLALVEINMVTLPQIFLPYAIMQDGRTLAEYVESKPEFLLGKSDKPIQ